MTRLHTSIKKITKYFRNQWKMFAKHFETINFNFFNKSPQNNYQSTTAQLPTQLKKKRNQKWSRTAWIPPITSFNANNNRLGRKNMIKHWISKLGGCRIVRSFEFPSTYWIWWHDYSLAPSKTVITFRPTQYLIPPGIHVTYSLLNRSLDDT